MHDFLHLSKGKAMTYESISRGFDYHTLFRAYIANSEVKSGYPALVALYLLNYHNRAKGYAFPSREALMRDLDMTMSAVNRSIRALKDSGEWHVESGRGGPVLVGKGASARANRYYPTAKLLKGFLEDDDEYSDAELDAIDAAEAALDALDTEAGALLVDAADLDTDEDIDDEPEYVPDHTDDIEPEYTDEIAGMFDDLAQEPVAVVQPEEAPQEVVPAHVEPVRAPAPVPVVAEPVQPLTADEVRAANEAAAEAGLLTTTKSGHLLEESAHAIDKAIKAVFPWTWMYLDNQHLPADRQAIRVASVTYLKSSAECEPVLRGALLLTSEPKPSELPSWIRIALRNARENIEAYNRSQGIVPERTPVPVPVVTQTDAPVSTSVDSAADENRPTFVVDRHDGDFDFDHIEPWEDDLRLQLPSTAWRQYMSTANAEKRDELREIVRGLAARGFNHNAVIADAVGRNQQKISDVQGWLRGFPYAHPRVDSVKRAGSETASFVNHGLLKGELDYGHTGQEF